MPSGRGDVETPQHKTIKMDGSQTRWIVISLIVYLFMADGFANTSFVQINDIVARNFNVSLEAVDWLAGTPSVASLGSLLIMTWITVPGLVGLRAWYLIAAGFVTLAFALIVIGVLSGYFFRIAILGQIFSGAANAINFSLTPLMAASWFPENERPTAIALTHAGLNAGNIIGLLVPSHILPKLNSTDAIVKVLVSAASDQGVRAEPIPVKWSDQVPVTLTSIFASFLAASVLFAFCSFLFIFDTPSPMQDATSLAEHSSKRCGYINEEPANLTQFIRAKNAARNIVSMWLETSKSLLFTKKFMALAIPYSVIMSICLLWFALMPDMFRFTSFKNVMFNDVDNATSRGATYVTSSNEMAGYVLSTFCGGGLLSGTMAGKLMRLLNYQHSRISCGAAWGVILGLFGIYTGFVAGSIEVVFTFTLLVGFCVPLASTALVVLLIEHINQVDRLTVGTWLAILSSTSACLLPIIGHSLFESFGPTSLHVFQIALTLAVAFFLIFVRRFYR